MLTKLTIRNFKLFDEVEIELGDRVVFIGPAEHVPIAALDAEIREKLDAILEAAQQARPRADGNPA